jgi:predicted GH43/DUF377 family glycosyl hydrolase
MKKIIFAVLFTLFAFFTCETQAQWVKHPEPVLGDTRFGTIFDIAVLKFGDTFHMYSSWRPRRAVALSTSTDGINWTFPDIVLSPVIGTDWEDDINRPVVVYKDSVFHMWYTGQFRSTYSAIGYATSKDGLFFTRQNDGRPVLSPVEPWEKVALMCPHVIWDEEAQLWKMWYSGGEQYEPDALGYATSKDGIHWDRLPEPVFRPNPNVEFEKYKVTAAQVVKRENDYLMFYIGFRDIDFASIGMARSKNGIDNWERYPGNPIIAPTPGSWDEDACYKPFAIREENRWMLWYNGRRRGPEYIGLVTHEGTDLGF